MSPELVWLIFLLPLASFIIISFFIRPFVNPGSKIAGYITIGAIGGSMILSFWVLAAVASSPNHELAIPAINWLNVGDKFHFQIGLMVDSLTAVMLVVVTVVSLMVQIYSQGYMKGDPGYHRYYAEMSLFTMAMLGLVMANSLLFMFVFWELVGLCSYLLIGFWFHRPSAAYAAKKAFIVTRIGDFGFLAGILLLYAHTGTFDIARLQNLAVTGILTGGVLTWAAIGIFAGAMGKSAQFPLHTWLPDAMEGPTPVSALIHAATMVAAGVFLVARTLPIFVNSIQAITTVAFIGGFTVVFAASMGMVMKDIKRVIAYSTISQLGYMMLGLGIAGMGIARGGNITLEAAKAAVALGIFHLFNHAFFKSLLFLGSGSVNHATGTFDMTRMGGLRKVMPWTYATFVIASLSLAGIWPFAGYWSKDEIVAKSLQQQPFLFALAFLGIFMTAFYIFRVIYLTFHGEYRGGAHEENGGHGEHHLHESPAVMLVPMVVLAILAAFSGFWNITGGFSRFMGEKTDYSWVHGLFGSLAQPLPWLSMGFAGLGILLAYAMYNKKVISPERVGNMFKPLYNWVYNKYYFDDLYENIFVRKFVLGALFVILQGFDTYVVDGIANGLGWFTRGTGRVIRRWETGQLQLYGLFIGIGAVAIILVVIFFG